MQPTPRFTYFLYSIDQPVQEDSEIWATPLPLSRKPPGEQSGVAVSHGDYFCAVRDFLGKDGFKPMSLALSQQTHRDVTRRAIKEIRIFLEKHGEFYHPARIETILSGPSLPLVVNVAVSGAGKDRIQNEYRLLKKLRREYSFPFLPRVYGQDMVFSKGAGLEIKMFLGEWFEGYNEFHLSSDPVDQQNKILVWDADRGNYFLTSGQSRELYRQAAAILTCCYDIETFEHIASWHHAAGDFVVKCQKGAIDVKLVTVRKYGPMFTDTSGIDPSAPEALVILEALLVFFLNLAIRMRLDRLDGVGEMVWADKMVVEQTLQGFSGALEIKPAGSMFAEPLAACFRKHLLAFTRTDLLDLHRALVHKFHPRAPHVAVIKQHLEQHVDELYDAVKRCREYPP